MPSLFSRIYGCILGGAIGDAMGGPVESLHYETIERDWGRVETLLPYRQPGGGRPRVNGQRRMEAGAYTDDTIHALLLAWSIGRKGGRVGAEDLAETWLEHAPMVNDLWYTEQIALYRWALAGVPAEEASDGNVPADNAVIGIAPIGLVNAGDPRQAAQDARQVAGLLNAGTSRTATGTVAAGVAAAMLPDATAQSVFAAARAVSEPQMVTALDRAQGLALRSRDDRDFREAFYETMLVEWPYRQRLLQIRQQTEKPGGSWGVDVHEVVPAAFGLFLLAKGDPRGTITGCVNFGRDCDSIASMGGHLSGALCGVEALPTDWQEVVTKASPFDLEAAARGVESALAAELGRARARLAALG
jgi:ADP-ribosylglycohydrolase